MVTRWKFRIGGIMNLFTRYGVMASVGGVIDGVILKLGGYVKGGVTGWDEPSGTGYTTDVTQVDGEYTQVTATITSGTVGIIINALPLAYDFTDFTNLKVEVGDCSGASAIQFKFSDNLYANLYSNGTYNIDVSSITTANMYVYIYNGVGTKYARIKKLTLT